MSRQTLAIILARAGSRGVPGKNSMPIAGRTCVAWTIDDALAATLVTRVVVSTDCERVAECARSMGVEAVARPPALASDTARVDDAARDCVRSLFGSEGDAAQRVDAVVLLYANAPVRPAGLIDRAVRTLRDGRFDSVQSYAPVGKHHPWWTAVVDERGGVRPWEGEVLNHNCFRRQDLPPAHIPDGGVLVTTTDALLLRTAGATPGPHEFFGAKRGGVLTRDGEVVDIDSPIDAIVADAILRERLRARAGA